MSKRAKVTFSLILVICLLLSGLPSAVPVAATEADEPLTSPITESTVTEPQAVAEQSTAVTEDIGFSGSDIGSGIIIHEYTTYTGSQLLISYTMDSNGSFIVSKICNGISTSN